MSWRSRRMWRLTARNATRFAGTKARRLVTPAERRAALDKQFAIRTAEDVAKELGEMKGVLMKVGQLVSFIAEGLPDEAQAGARPRCRPTPPRWRRRWPPRSSRRELGGRPGAGLPALGRPARRRRQHRPGPPGRDHRTAARSPSRCSSPASREAIEEDLDGAEVMYNVFSAMALNGLDARGLVDELRARMREELDYRLEARQRRRVRRATSPATPGCASPSSCPSCRTSGC